MNLRQCISLTVFVLAGGASVATAQTFAGFVVAGANANQIQGDDLAGYNLLGGYGGVGVYNDISDRWRWSLTIAFSQHGSRATGLEVSRMQSAFDRIRLNYVAVPVAIHLMDWLSEDETFYKLEFCAGLEYYRLISAEVTGVDGVDITDIRPYRDNVLGVSVGALYVWSLKWGAGLYYNRGITDAQGLDIESLQSLTQLSFRLRRTF